MQKINFIRERNFLGIISFLCILLTLFFIIFFKGFNLGIDFSSGLNINLTIKKAALSAHEIETNLKELLSDPLYVQEVILSQDNDSSAFSIIVRNSNLDFQFKKDIESAILNKLSSLYESEIIVEDSYFIDSTFSSSIKIKSIFLVLFTFLLILVYLSFRFQISYALSAIFALFYDLSFIIAFIGLFQIEVSSSTIVAILTIIGYSLNDTIVIFDRIRENFKNYSDKNLLSLVNDSINQTLSRTLLTSFTTFLAVFSIYLFTQGAIKDFALIFMMGIIIGTFSSIFIAASLFIFFYKRFFLKRDVR